jgi:sugar (pentulose or hexulose) kinase
MAIESSYFVGLDIGGTTVKAVLVNHLAEQAGPSASLTKRSSNSPQAQESNAAPLLESAWTSPLPAATASSGAAPI